MGWPLATQFGKPAALRGGGTCQVQVSQGFPGPQRQRTAKACARRGRVAGGQRAHADDRQLLKDLGVQLSFGNPQQVAARLAGDPRPTAPGLVSCEQPAQLPDVGVHQAARAGRLPLAPHLVYQLRC